jgi:F420-non-reducing hydrogenase iron-sulfur subunit
MCSGRVDLEFVLRAFFNGTDGVFIGGCHLGECNYVTHGNFDALNMVLLCRKIMEYLGLNPERLNIRFMSAGDGIPFAQIMNDVSRKVKQLGPLCTGESEEADPKALSSKIQEVMKLIPYIKIVKGDKLSAHLKDPEEYESFFTIDEIKTLIDDAPAYYIDPEKCKACMICAKRCPVEAITGAKKLIHVIDQEKCIKCGTCFEACPPRFGAVTRISGEPVPPHLSEAERTIQRVRKTVAQSFP